MRCRGSSCCFSDVTERKLAEDRLRESEMRLRTLIEQSPLAISFSRDGITLEVNAHYLSMFGYASADEVSATPLLQRIAPSHRAEMQDLIERRRGGLPAPTTYETVGLRRDGSEFPALRLDQAHRARGWPVDHVVPDGFHGATSRPRSASVTWRSSIS